MEKVKSGFGRAMKWFWIGSGLLFLLALGTCVMSIGGLAKASLETQSINEEFLAQVHANGLPPLNDEIYGSAASDWSQTAINQLNFYVRGAGPIVSSESPSCTAHSAELGSDGQADYVECETVHTHEQTDAISKVVWRKEDGEWRVLSFNYDIQNAELADQILRRMGLR
ncbi:hypothetical protein [Ponticaulis sp.]|uniref:hypothetical protein n=1 Tax=Ponticaulis sp. TaxID=2020902 RepID=UPI000B760ECC|nr:hypothetical protein [Ponticaulis sp.]MAI90075.1 hypothetical protein [Ponticaulis sp.]OUX99731.1 MAG: hypothetical protein CBB65_06515 [Hyphomonadaceae bacterium TMED5]|tara:strand:+ start:32260 stop:32766 length:507 start_codon:yes stop_codon:yes gene_type:complete